MEIISKEIIAAVFKASNEHLDKIRENLGEEGFFDFCNRKNFYYAGLPAGHTLDEYLTEAVYNELNQKYIDEFFEWRKKHFKVIKSKIHHGDRGEYYYYVKLFDNLIFAIGDEQGNYSGGDTANAGDSIEDLQNQINKLGNSTDEQKIDLFNKIRAYKVINDEQYRVMISQRNKYPKDFDFCSNINKYLHETRLCRRQSGVDD